MKGIDRFLQNWRIRKAHKYIPSQARVLDIGSFDGTLFEKIKPKLLYGIGIDPLCEPLKTEHYELRRGLFPNDLTDQQPFDAITLLAVLEHIPEQQLADFAQACERYLVPGGKLIITVPHTDVDKILAVLQFLRLIDGMSLEEHHGFNTEDTNSIFTSAGLVLHHKSTFQLGLNNLFVFSKPI